MKLFMRVIAVGLWLYAFMLFQASPAQGTVSYIRTTWGNDAVTIFIAWFIVSGGLLLLLSRLSIHAELAWFFVMILPQLFYSLAAISYVLFEGVLSNHNAQWGAATTHGFGASLLLTIIYYFYRDIMGHGNDSTRHRSDT